MTRPAESLSLTQNAALTATGLIWTRWCLIIKPRNILYVSTHLAPVVLREASVSLLLIFFVQNHLLIKYSLATVNFFLGVVGIIQVSRIVSYNMSVKDKGAKEQFVEAKEGAKEVAKGLEKDVVKAVKGS